VWRFRVIKSTKGGKMRKDWAEENELNQQDIRAYLSLMHPKSHPEWEEDVARRSAKK
jgi:hypothetical protein